MAYRSTLEIYDDLMASGHTEAQSRATANQLDWIGQEHAEMRLLLAKIDKDLIWMRVIGAAMTFAFLSTWFHR
jgi:hypothetical protein